MLSTRRRKLFLEELIRASAAQAQFIRAAFEGETDCIGEMMNESGGDKYALWGQVVDQVRRWRSSVGAEQVSTEQEVQDCGWLCHHHGGLTIKELELLIDLYVDRKLPLEYYYNVVNFHPVYMATVIRAYVKLRNDALRDIIARVELALLEPDPPTPTERVNTMRWMVTEVKSQLDKRRPVVFGLTDVFKFLKRTGRVKDNQPGRFNVYYMKNYQHREPVPGGRGGDLRPIGEILGTDGANLPKSRETAEMEFYVLEWFKTGKIDTLLSRITEKDFV